MGYKYERSDILAAAVEAVLDEGLSRLTFGRLAKRMGINDRSIVYYFPTKHDLVVQTAFAVASDLQQALEEAFGDERLPADELLRRAWPVLGSPATDPVLAVFFEVVGLGAAGVSPFDELGPALIEGWVDWLTPRVLVDDPANAEATALGLLARLDGLLLLRHTVGPRAANRAAAALGVAG